jgi:outer membrane receptor protein involved in Fe transport
LQQRETAGLVGPAPPPQEVVGGRSEAIGEGVVEAAQLINQSINAQTVSSRQRSPVSLEPHIRGFTQQQIYIQSDGAYYFPARDDLDTVLNKLDPSIIDNIDIVPGPYGVQYGPGFGFINVATLPTPRYACPESHLRAGITFHGNGDRLYYRESVYGGGADYGYRFAHGGRQGNAYESGNGTDIPADYQSQNFFAQIGFDISPFQTIEVQYQRLDQTDTIYPGQFFNIDFLGTDAMSVRIKDESPEGPWTRLTVDTWYNHNRFTGSTPDRSDTTFNVDRRLEEALGFPEQPGDPFYVNSFFGNTLGDNTSTGARAAATFGDLDDSNISFGADFRYLDQRIAEHFEVRDNLTAVPPYPIGPLPPFEPIDTNLPRAFAVDPGLYSIWVIPMESYWKTTVGARVDFFHTGLNENPRPDGAFAGISEEAFSRDDILYGFYLNNAVVLDPNWTTRFGVGHGQRAPSLTERYADNVFLSVIQDGFSRVTGNPDLTKERNWQIDVSIQGIYDDFRFRLGGYHSWILDYSTYQVNVISDPSDARLMQSINTPLATLAGCEAAVEYELSDWWTTFGTINYVDGRDRGIDAPLGMIFPFESIAGLRLHDPRGGRIWGIELTARMVDQQNRLGTYRISTGGDVDVLEQLTPGFTVWNLRGYYNVTDNFNMVAGIQNLFDRNYLEHLNLRLPQDGTIPAAAVYNVGFTPYIGAEVTY